MKTIILPGFSLHNKEWAEGVADSKAIVHNWPHWKTNSQSLSLRYEVKEIIKEIGKEKVNIVAKSVGTMVTMHLLQIIPEKIGKIILCGIPSVSEERKKLFTTALLDFSVENILVFQNTNDPLASFSEVKDFLKSVNPEIKVIEKPRSDHNYPYSEDFKKFLN